MTSKLMSGLFKKGISLWASLLVLFLIMLSVMWYFDGKIERETQHNAEQELTQRLVHKKQLLNGEVQKYRNYINFLVGTPPIQGISRARSNQGIDPKDSTTTEQWKMRLAKIFSSMMYTYPEIDQLRLIDSQTGDELVRTDRYGGLVSAQPQSKLQNKAHREYFTETIKLKERRIYVSQIDLNREHGEIVYPLEPTLRLAAPVYNEQNELFTVLVVNIDAQLLLEKIKKASLATAQFMLLSSDGHFVYHPDEMLRFSKDLANHETWQSNYDVSPWFDTSLLALTHKQSKQKFLAKHTELFVASNSQSGHIQGVTMLPMGQYEEYLLQNRLNVYSLILIIGIIFTLGLLLLWVYFRNNQQLLEARSQLADIINGASDGIIGFNEQLGIVSHNAAAEWFFPELKSTRSRSYSVLKRYIPEEYIHSTLYNVTHQRGLETLEIKAELLGESRDLELSASPIRSSDGKLLGFALFITDVTDQNKAKAEIVKMNASLELQVEQRTLELGVAKRKAEELSKVKSAFISNISHEMRTPLNGILGTLELVRREPLSQQQGSYLDMMSTSAKTLMRLINDVLDLSKIEAGKLEMNARPFNPLEILEHVTSSVSVRAQQKSIDYMLDAVDVMHLRVVGDGGRLKQILYNLISNAIKFTQSGGVYIYAKTKEYKEQVWLEVEVRDTGIGISKQGQSQLFQAFSQESIETSSEYGGSGLGLSICKQLCELMGGSINFTSEKGQGSNFYFSIPYPLSDAKKLEIEPILADKKVYIAAKSNEEEAYFKKFLNLYGARMCDLNQADLWLVDVGIELGQNLANASGANKKACFVYDPVNDPFPTNKALAVLAKPVRYVDVLAAINREDTLRVFGHTGMSLLDRKTYGIEFDSLDGQTVVVVDDNQINLEVARGILNAHNVVSVLVHSGQELLEKLNSLAAQEVEILAILMDCNMPLMDGYETTAAIRAGLGGQLYQTVPIIALTASTMQGEAQRCKAAGMNEYISKPIDSLTLFKTLLKYQSPKGSSEAKKSKLPDSKNSEETVPSDKDDMKVLDRESALGRLMNDESLYVKICELFKESANARFSELTEAVEAVNHERIKQAAHAIKGQAGDVGAKRLHHWANSLECAANDEEQSENCRELYLKVQAELEQVCIQIESQVLNAAS
ncbi:ATP-binding protein [Pseudoalteromonas sp. MMG022]|uniref:ATP-binding protein n=1 Tax=Pseudoalteromonas sp. MMG022 TaxID=2909978 RepID=UPI0031BB3623|nr:ATP-binding protein [Pseudoalteromonas sp. MMG022]